ncbi:hypothetical protein Sjap_024557 [Stephania japonica]|uniref:Disease resistance protein RGA3 n=1 Tax=Stephania japonica TaxID=461633 RepID=A0AAP0HQ89_9MAGN
MADALVSALFQSILNNLNSALLREFALARGLNRQIQNLSSAFSAIQSVLHDAENRQHQHQHQQQAVTDWLSKLKSVAHDAEDLLDDLATEALIHNSIAPITFKDKVRNFFKLGLGFRSFRFRLNMAREIERVLERLSVVGEERLKLHLVEGVRSLTSDGFDRLGERERRRQQRGTSSFVIEAEIYGRELEKERMIGELLKEEGEGEDVASNVAVHAIFGMGGIGKTTLAQLVYNDERVQRHFECRMWVCVSEEFEAVTVSKAILESATGSGCMNGMLELDPLQRRICEILRGKRFLLVLDDVWNEDQEKWSKMKPVLRYGAKGSSIITTTRTEKVGRILGALPRHCHHLGGLSNEDCWSLFRERAFGVDRVEEPSFVSIGEEIVRKCGGVPLAVKAVGGLLRFKSEECEWISVMKSKLWDLSDDGNDILPSLRLSYNHLPLHLRQCFTYCSIFPKDHWIQKGQLIQLWMANGFISPRGQMDLEEIGNEVFNDLLWRSFFQDPARDEFGDIIECRIHDLMHDLAQSIMKDECIFVEHDLVQEVSKGHLHLACKSENFRTFHLDDLNKFRRMRSILLLSEFGKVDFHFSSDISKEMSLRLRALECPVGSELPKFVSNCKHLRYLNLSSSFIKLLPESITYLQNLQTLLLNSCELLLKLPNGMRHMRNLRNLDIKGCRSLTYMPIYMGELTRLQVLSTYIVGEDDGNHIGELRYLNLKGEIEIKNLDNVKDLVDAKMANFSRKHRLNSLTLTWQGNVNAEPQVNVEEVLEGLAPPSSLKKLVIHQYRGSIFPNWIGVSSLPNLIEIRLRGCEKCEHFPPLEELPLLQYLEISRMNVKYLVGNLEGDIDELRAYRLLHSLYVLNMPNLECFATSQRRTIFPCLQRLHITGCHKFTKLPQLPSLTDLCIQSCHGLIPLPQLPSLRVLNVENGNVVFSEEGLQGSSNLRSLVIRNSPHTNSLSEGLRYLTALSLLYVSNIPKLTCLPESIRHLASIKKMYVSDCCNLTSLPEGMDHLTSLKHLSITGCPHLQLRLQRKHGEDWNKIPHGAGISLDIGRI